jgi:ribosomal protein L6P/L9E
MTLVNDASTGVAVAFTKWLPFGYAHYKTWTEFPLLT